MEEKLYVVRLWDGMDGCWIDISKPVSHDKATEIWNKHTHNGTTKTTFSDLDYYRIFPADTRMIFNSVRPMYRPEEWK